jgi:hypothetical protein
MKSEIERLYLYEKAMDKQRFIEDAISSIKSAGIRSDLIEELQKELVIAKKEVKDALQELDHKSKK